MVSKNPVDSFSLRNAEMDDESIAKVKEALENSGNLKVCVKNFFYHIYNAISYALVQHEKAATFLTYWKQYVRNFAAFSCCTKVL